MAENVFYRMCLEKNDHARVQYHTWVPPYFTTLSMRVLFKVNSIWFENWKWKVQGRNWHKLLSPFSIAQVKFENPTPACVFFSKQFQHDSKYANQFCYAIFWWSFFFFFFFAFLVMHPELLSNFYKHYTLLTYIWTKSRGVLRFGLDGVVPLEP